MSNVTAYEIKKALSEKHQRDFFLTECKSGSTWMTRAGDMKILDGLAIRKSWTSPCFTGYEVKVSRSDFLRDAKFYTYSDYKAINEVLHNHHIWGFRGTSIAEELDQALARKCPDDISDLRKSLEIILARVQRMEAQKGAEE